MAFCGRASRAILRGNDESARIITRNGFENSFSHRGHQTFFRTSRSRGAAPHAARTSERGRILAVAAQVVLVAPLQDVVEFGKQARPVCRQIAFQKEGVRDAPIRACSHSMSLVPSSSHSSRTQFSVSSPAERRQVTPCRVSSALGTKAGTDSKTHLKLRALGFCFCPKRHCG